MSTTIERLDNIVVEATDLALTSTPSIKLQLVGPQGVSGIDGISGVDGVAGPQGPQGNTGPQGIAGFDGSGAVHSINSQIGNVVIPIRELLNAHRSYYVRTDGSDSNDGLTDSSAGAFLTIQKALNVVGSLDTVIYNVAINVRAGTYVAASGRNTVKAPLGTGSIIIIGDVTTPSNVVISTTTHGFLYSDAGRTIKIHGFKTIGGGNSISSNNASVELAFFEFANTGAHMVASSSGSITVTGNYEISNGASRHIWARNRGSVQITGRTVTLTGSPAFAFFIQATLLAYVSAYSTTYIGSAAGQTYNINGNSMLEIYGTTPAGDTAGAASSGAVVL